MEGMLKKETKLLYLYEIIKEYDKSSPMYFLHIGDTLYNEDSNLDKEHYKILATCRHAFVGDMQNTLQGEREKKDLFSEQLHDSSLTDGELVLDIKATNNSGEEFRVTTS